MDSLPCLACVAFGSPPAGQMHADLRVTAPVVEIVSRRRHASGGYLCSVCGLRWDWSETAGWRRRDPGEQEP